MNPTIQLKEVGKKYSLGTTASSTLRETLSGVLKSGRRPFSDFWALRDITFSVNQGEVVGIIGRNGAGKSTLLKILSKITKPTTGIIQLQGRLASLLEVGTGFHPELTGRENIYLNGTILGMRRREVDLKLDEIIEFSGVEKFLETPVKRFSSGMYVRLAFAVAAHLETDILVVDEVLAVGDFEFQRKCLGKMSEVASDGRTVLFVSHDLGAVRNLCSRGILMHEGQVQFDGKIEETIKQYVQSGSGAAESFNDFGPNREGNGKVRYKRWRLVDDLGNRQRVAFSGEPLRIELDFEAKEDSQNVVFWLMMLKDGAQQFVCSTHLVGPEVHLTKGSGKITLEVKKNMMFSGSYSFHLLVLVNGEFADYLPDAGEIDIEDGDFYGTGKMPNERTGVLVDHAWCLD